MFILGGICLSKCEAHKAISHLEATFGIISFNEYTQKIWILCSLADPSANHGKSGKPLYPAIDAVI